MCIEKQFFYKLQSLGLKKKVALAASSGVDSTALLLLTNNWAQKSKSNIIILTVNHNLRSESEFECEHVHELAKSLHLECHTLKWDNPISKQNKARIARYKLLTEWCKKHQVQQLLLAHHKNDQAETVLMRLCRGSGIDGLCGMRELSLNNGIELIRPFLQFTKGQLTQYVVSRNIKWIEDASNNNNKYTRTIFRNYINSSSDPDQLISRLFLTSSHMQCAKQAINFYVKQAIKHCVIENKLGYVDINLAHLYIFPEEILKRVILTCIMVIGGKSYKPRYKNFNNILEKILNKEFNQTQTLHGCKIIKIVNKMISIRREASYISTEEILISPDNAVIWDNRFKCEANYTAIICKNHSNSGIQMTLPILKYNNHYIDPFEDDNCKFEFIFSHLVLDVLS